MEKCWTCPCPKSRCPHLLEDGRTCDMEEPWLDCDDYIKYYEMFGDE